MSLTRTVEKIIPLRIKKVAKSTYDLFIILQSNAKHKKVLAEVRKKEKIKVAFFLIHSSIWKYDGVYKLMVEDIRFDPVVIICPYIAFGKETMLADMKASIEFCIQKGYKFISTYNEADGNWLDIKKEIGPDIVFFTNPHKLTREEYYINNWRDTLTCYVPYAFMTPDTYESQFNQLFHNIVWRAFYETPIHKKIAESYSLNRGINVRITGYPGCDDFLESKVINNYTWKIDNPKIKRIVWAPHHLMKDGSLQSNFLEMYQFFIDIAEKYKDKIQIAFKPHPIIKPKLYSFPEWGKKRTDDYYKLWDNLENGQLVEGDYVDLFLTSDALIHDCGSFITEYIFTKKPSLFMIRNQDVMKGWNEFGDMALNVLYQSKNKAEIIEFIENVVLEGKDTMQNVRLDFLNSVLLPPNNLTASQNILQQINNELFN